MFKKLLISGAFLIPFFLIAQENTVTSQSRIAVIPSVGYAWRLAKIPSGTSNETRDYIKGLKSGFDVSLGTYYLLNGNGAIGLKYSGYFASSNGRITVQDFNGQIASQLVTTNDNISFFGPSYMFSNFKEDTKHKLYYDISVGVITYVTKTRNITGKGANIGADFNFAYQYALSNNIFIGPKIGFTGGTLSKMKYNGTTVDFGEDEGEGLTRLSLSAAATFRF